MLRELRIADLGVIAAAALEPAPGLTVVTGETGAGKTLVVTGLGLLAGGRSDSGLVRTGARRALVEARFEPVTDAVAEQVEGLGGELDEGELVVVRQVGGDAASGGAGSGGAARSRATVAGVGVPVAVAARVGADLVTIHGQSEQTRLGSPARQRAVLDRAAGADMAPLAQRYGEAFEARRRLRAELAELRANARQRAHDADMLRFGLDEIGRVEPLPGEDAALVAEQRRLQDADELRQHALEAVVALAGDEDLDVASALSLVDRARRALALAARSDEAARALAEQAGELAALAADLAGGVSGYLADLEADPARLEHIAGRLAELQRLTRKYGDTADAVIAWAQDAAARLAALEGSDERVAEIERDVAGLDLELDGLADAISGLRRSTAARLQSLVETELRALALPHARLEFAVTDLDELGPSGRDAVTILFTANPGSAAQPLGKVASGGELSRVRLALEVVLAGADDPATLVFDEIDAGIGGAVGTEVGRRLARLARSQQVIVVTHLAQVAAFADRHYVVTKAADGA
ncbi:MAG: DNA repair protein RecN, partial [Propionibacteriaceae bacterium]|nr:DNA repair protein RecN [Propionibacteriaceae bacterium]